MKATGDVEKIRRWAKSPEGVRAIKGALEWARRKGRELERSQRLTSEDLLRQVTR